MATQRQKSVHVEFNSQESMILPLSWKGLGNDWRLPAASSHNQNTAIPARVHLSRPQKTRKTRDPAPLWDEAIFCKRQLQLGELAVLMQCLQRFNALHCWSFSSLGAWNFFISVWWCEHFPHVGGWGEASLQGQSTPTGRSFRPVRACVRAVLFMSNQG